MRASKKRKLQQEGEDGSSANRVKEPSAKKAKGESPGKILKKKNKFKKEGETEKPTETKLKSRNAGHSQGKKTQKVKGRVSKGGINGVQSGKSAKVKNGAKVHKKNSA